MPLYEAVVIARQDLATAQVDELNTGIQTKITELGGKPGRVESWGLRNLAYKIEKNRKGHYTLFQFDAPPTAVQELERTMRINEDVLRYLTIKVDAFDENPSAILRQPEEREEGGFGGDRFGSDRAGAGGDRGYRSKPRRDNSDTGE
jgi:small subunit ribosomal protein S6